MENELATTLDALRDAGESEHEIDERLAAIFTAEADRVETALLVADLVAERPIAPPAARRGPPGSTPAFSAPHSSPALRPAPRDIADFIDEMIAQESNAAQRRAS